MDQEFSVIFCISTPTAPTSPNPHPKLTLYYISPYDTLERAWAWQSTELGSNANSPRPQGRDAVAPGG